MTYSDNSKKEYMRMFFDNQPKDFCLYVIDGLKMNDESRNLLKLRYVENLSDKEIARKINLSHFYINKQINKALTEAYDALKHFQYNGFKTAKQ